MGTSHFGKIRQLNIRDHPHACGDKAEVPPTLLKSIGSSPRVWGQANEATKEAELVRIIPTRVGTRCLLENVLQVAQDHPHACGDKDYARENEFDTWGSSPRVWGQVERFQGLDKPLRIIPTRVGTRALRLSSSR